MMKRGGVKQGACATKFAAGIVAYFWNLRIWRDTHGQDIIEYALMVGFLVIAAAASLPSVNTNISKIFSQVLSTLTQAAAQS